MANKHGDFVWYELATKDALAAQDFYGPLLGWTFEVSGQPDMPYYLFSKNGTQVGGMMSLTDDMIANGAAPLWAGYVEVGDIQTSTEKAQGLGASVYVPPTEIPGIGRFSMIADPQGAPIYMMEDLSGEESTSFAKHTPQEGHCAWNELATTDPGAAAAFYSEMFGWKKSGEMDMGPIGLYVMYSVNGYGLGAMMRKPDEMPMSAWVYYLRVPDIDAAVEHIASNGGQLIGDPQEIPGGDYTLMASDPQGAVFALIGKRN
ncbi:MAG: VOC family protein [Pseudomonadota bacterium]